MRSLAIFVACLMPACFAHAQIPQTERTALIALYKATDGANWTYSFNWRNGDDTDFNAVGTECTWDGVTCDGGHVTEIVLGGYPSGNNLVGTIPSELGNLSNLTELSLTYNQLSGSIPPELGNLSNLTELVLDSNQLSGVIPRALEFAVASPLLQRAKRGHPAGAGKPVELDEPMAELQPVEWGHPHSVGKPIDAGNWASGSSLERSPLG